MNETARERIDRESEKIRAFLDLLSVSKKQNVKLLDMLHDINNEQQDLLHELELKKFYGTEGTQIAKEIQRLRQLRRGIKDTLDLWRPIKDFANNHAKLRQELEEVLKKIDNIARQQATRVYYPRVKESSNIKGKHYETVRMNVEALLGT
jgi:hypothetical protein